MLCLNVVQQTPSGIPVLQYKWVTRTHFSTGWKHPFRHCRGGSAVLRILAAPAEDSGLIPGPHIAAPNHLQLQSHRLDAHFWPLWPPHDMHTDKMIIRAFLNRKKYLCSDVWVYKRNFLCLRKSYRKEAIGKVLSVLSTSITRHVGTQTWRDLASHCFKTD